MIIPLIIIARIVSFVSKVLNIGMGGTWPGEIALRLKPDILTILSRNIKEGVILISGTNGKTTTTHLLKSILEKDGKKVIINKSGANLLNGVVSALLTECDLVGQLKADYAVFEVDENSLPAVISNIHPPAGEPISHNNQKLIIVLLNLFRDQLDRYGEVDVITQKWDKALSTLDSGDQYIKRYHTTLVLNCDDPQIAYLGIKSRAKVRYFGLSDKKDFLGQREHATDSAFCPKCGQSLNYEGIFFSHLGIWKCSNCSLTRPKPEIISNPPILSGKYNKYNTFAAVLAARECKVDPEKIKSALKEFTPAFGRQEEFIIQGKKIKVFLSKNPVGFNESLKTVINEGAQNLLIILNDRIPDGRDVSWIWDVDFEMIPESVSMVVSGERVYDMALRIKYSKSQILNPNDQTHLRQSFGGQANPKSENQNVLIEPNLKTALEVAIKGIDDGDMLYILPTYSAMLEVRKLLKS